MGGGTDKTIHTWRQQLFVVKHKHPQHTLKEHQWVRTFATVSKDSDMNLQWWSMRNNLFKPLLLVQ